ASNQVDTLIPLLLARYSDPQIAVDIAISMHKNALDNFETAASLLLTLPAVEELRVREDVIAFIDACRYACTSNFRWRYGFAPFNAFHLDYNLRSPFQVL
ncbi:MAG: hypothetical protein Q9195_007222, partial [Heterodermia aff. obscurata]